MLSSNLLTPGRNHPDAALLQCVSHEAWKKELVPRNNSSFVDQRLSWAGLPHDLLFMIFSRFQDIYNRSSLNLYPFLAVCRSWRFAAKQTWQNNILSTTPWLLIQLGEKTNMVAFNTNLHMRHHRDASVVTTSTTAFRFSLPDIGRRPISGPNYKITHATCDGWLFLRAPFDYQFYLYNPITGVSVQLPKLPSFLVVGITDHIKFVISGTSPTDSNCIICLKSSGDRKSIRLSKSENKSVLAFCKPASSSSWVLLDDNVEDMIFYGGKFYTIDSDGALFIYNDDAITGKITATSSSWKEKKIAEAVCSWYDQEWFRFFYLVESKTGELLMIKRIFRTKNPITRSFRIFKLNSWHIHCHYHNYWEEIDNLPEKESLYLGWNEIMSISVDNNGVHNTYKPNCIYFFDQLFKGQSLGGPPLPSRLLQVLHSGPSRFAGQFTGQGMYDLENHKLHYQDFDEEDEDIDPPGPKFHCLLFSPAKLSNV